jgi:nitrous oxide reductase
MEENTKSKKNLSRRKFLGSTATVAAFSLMPVNLFGKSSSVAKEATGTKPNSNFGGVQIGTITYSWRDKPGGVENIIK